MMKFQHQACAAEYKTSHTWTAWHSWGEQQGQGSGFGSKQRIHAKTYSAGLFKEPKCVGL